MKKNKINKIAELLPEGLNPNTVNEIAKLVDAKINEEVTARIDKLTTSFHALLRTRIDSIKEQALKELELENDNFRKLQVFNEMRALMAVELTENDTDNAISILAKESKEYEDGVTTLTEELNKVITENTKYETVIQALHTKVEELEGKLKLSLVENTDLKSKTAKPFKSSERAAVISENKENSKEKTLVKVNNEFLTEEVLKMI